MPWFKVDDKLHDHRKARAAGSAAMGVWVLAGSWAADNLSDGFIPSSLLPRWGRQREATKLVEVGLWHPCEQDGEEGWRFHEWDERQPTRAQKEAERKAKADAGRAGGVASGQSRREANAKQSASGLVELPSRPDPTIDSSFDDFWSAYPRKVAKGQARKAWPAALKKASADEITAAAEAFAVRHVPSTDPKFIPHAATWLNGERWADETPQQSQVDEHGRVKLPPLPGNFWDQR